MNHPAKSRVGKGPGRNSSGNTEYNATWAVETNYYMDLGFLPYDIQFFSISGRAAWYGPKGDTYSLPALSGPGRFSTASETEFNQRTNPSDV